MLLTPSHTFDTPSHTPHTSPNTTRFYTHLIRPLTRPLSPHYPPLSSPSSLSYPPPSLLLPPLLIPGELCGQGEEPLRRGPAYYPLSLTPPLLLPPYPFLSQESYVDKVKNLFVGVQPISTVDGGVLALSDKGRAFRFIHRWPLLMQVIMMHACCICLRHIHTPFTACFATPPLLSSPYLCSPLILSDLSFVDAAGAAAAKRACHRQQPAHPPERVR